MPVSDAVVVNAGTGSADAVAAAGLPTTGPKAVEVVRPFQPEDLDKLEKRMQEIVKSGQVFRRRRFDSVEQAREELAGEPYKLELVDLKGDVDATEVMEVGGGELTIYDNADAKTGERC